MSPESSRSFGPDVLLAEVVEERFTIYRDVALAARALPRPLRNGNQNMVSDAKLERLWNALDRLTDHSEDMEVML